MTKRERLLEAYEDAFFAIVMSDIAEKEGHKFIEENEKLKNSSDFEMPNAIHEHSLKIIRKSFRKKRFAAAAKKAYGIMNKVAVFFLTASILFTTAYAVIPEVRVGTLNLLINTSNVSTQLTMVNNSGGVEKESAEGLDLLLGYKLPAIPNGFILERENIAEGISGILTYKDANENILRISVLVGEGSNVYIDTENADVVEEFSINGNNGLLVEKENSLRATVADAQNGRFIDIYSTGISEEFILDMVTEMVISNE